MSLLIERLKKIIADNLGVKPSDIQNSDNFMEDLGADSLDLVEMVMNVEDEFEIEIPDSDMVDVNTPEKFIAYLKSRGIE
jgi:acyl carrier protein